MALYALIGDEVRLASLRDVQLSDERLQTKLLFVWCLCLTLLLLTEVG